MVFLSQSRDANKSKKWIYPLLGGWLVQEEVKIHKNEIKHALKMFIRSLEIILEQFCFLWQLPSSTTLCLFFGNAIVVGDPGYMLVVCHVSPTMCWFCCTLGCKGAQCVGWPHHASIWLHHLSVQLHHVLVRPHPRLCFL